MGNHVTIKGAATTSMVLEEWVRLMIKCGMPKGDVNLIHANGSAMGKLVETASSNDTLRFVIDLVWSNRSDVSLVALK